ncbi:hypothetical protein Tco_1010666, partial [Tanacetum coccineum]
IVSFITAQQTKLDLELVPKENRLDIGKCNGRIPRGLTPREPTFQVVLDAIALTPCYHAFLITADVPEICPRVPGKDFDAIPSEEDIMSFLREHGHTGEINSLNDVVVDQMHQAWRTVASLINRGFSEKTSGLDKLRLFRAKILWESTQIYGALLPECLTSPVMKESKACKTYVGYATGDVPPKMAQKFKKASPSKKTVDVIRGKGIELLSEVALTEEAQMKEVSNKSLRDFHKTHPSGSGTVAKKPQSADKITPIGIDEDDNNNEQESSNEGSEQENKSDEQESDLEKEEEYEDDDQEEEEFVHTPTDDKDGDNLESESDDVIKSDEEKGMYDTTYQFDDDVDARLKGPTQTDKEKTKVPVTNSSRSSDLASKFLNFSDIPHADVEIVSPLDVHVHHEVPRTQAPTLLNISISVITESSHVYTNIPQSLQTFTPLLILTTPNPPPTIKTTNSLSTLPDFASVF